LLAQNSGVIHTRFAFGLECATAQLQSVEPFVDSISAGTSPLNIALDRVDDLRSALGLEGR
jgi:hypothetical protein